MSKILIVGDMHVKLDNLEDSQRLFDLIYETTKNNACSVVFTGDLTHSHSVLRLEVANLIKQNIKKLSSITIVGILVGNHDGSSPHSIEINSLRLLLGELTGVEIFDKPKFFGNSRMLPFTANNEEFVSWCNEYPDDVIICHQTFDGAQYENGFYAVGGVNPSLVPNPLVICGHIHKETDLGRIKYVGSPRALNANEYNESKYIWLFDDSNLQFVDKIKTDPFVKCFYRAELNEGDSSESLDWLRSVKSRDSVTIYLNGSKEYVDSIKQSISDFSSNFKIVPMTRKELSKTITVDGTGNSVEKAMKEYLDTVLKVPENIKEKVWETIAALI
jgi:DNA repair exonuclease SbcCD nuclease subunit